MTAMPDIDTEGRGHPPSAHGLILIDFDDTIVPWGDSLMGPKEPFWGIRETFASLIREGFTIGIFTSRLSPTWCANAGTTVEEQTAYVANTLTAHNVPYSFITAEKLPAEAYFDDKAYRVQPGFLANTLALWRINRAP